MESSHLCVALGPLAIYLVWLAAINLRRRPTLVSGGRDLTFLGLAVSGLLIVGPIELFFPETAAIHFGPYVWLFLLAFYALALALAVLSGRPRLLVYNAAAEELRPVLVQAAAAIDPQSQWAGDSLTLPTLGVQLHLEESASMRNVALVATGDRQNGAGWHRLAAALAAALREVRVARNPSGISFALLGLMIVAALGWVSFHNPRAIAQGLCEMLRL
ncbi:MAG: hypothetical protein ACYC35_06260 [Pirellulales bacterium]